MHISKLKIKPRRAPHVQPCAVELAEMLSCWARNGDLMSDASCREATTRLHECMTKPTATGKRHASTINYHLARLSSSRR